MIRILFSTLLYKLYRTFGFPKNFPINYTISVTYRCNSKCKTCNVYKKEAVELTLDEYTKIFKSLGNSPYWITFSGGEPFLRKELVQICESVYKICHPAIINIPTNGILCDIIPQKVAEICEICRDSKVVVNLSLDNVEEKHDAIRGIPGNYAKSMKTLEALKNLRKKYSNFTVGIGTVISEFNVDEFPEIYENLIKLEPDSYVTEIAEERIELDTMNAGITPSAQKYEKVIDFLTGKMKEQKLKGFARITRAFRYPYYRMALASLREKRQIIPCYAGIASAQISPDADVWTCCILAEPIGNLRESDYDFKKVWFSNKANNLRKKIKNKECYCPLANVSYTNMLCSYKTLFKIAINVLKG